jgi:hypothetical protein
MNASSILFKRISPRLHSVVRLQSVQAKTAGPVQIPETIRVDDHIYYTDPTYNLSPKIHALLEVSILVALIILAI